MCFPGRVYHISCENGSGGKAEHPVAKRVRCGIIDKKGTGILQRNAGNGQERRNMGIVVIGAVFVDIKGFPEAAFIPTGRNVGRVEQVHGGVGRNVAEDIANCELRPTFVSLVDRSGAGEDVLRKLKSHKVNTDYIRKTDDGMGTYGKLFL